MDWTGRPLLLVVLPLVLGAGCASLEGGPTSTSYPDQGEQVRELRVDADVDNHDPDPADEVILEVSGQDNGRNAYRFAANVDITVKTQPQYVDEEPEVVYEDSTHVSPRDFEEDSRVHFPYLIDDGELDEDSYTADVSVTFDATGHTYEDGTFFSYGG